MEAILLSLHPKYWPDMLSGRKTLELRKTYPRRTDNGEDCKVYVYLTAPTCAVVGEFMYSGCFGLHDFCDPLEMQYYADCACVSAEELLKYAGGKNIWCWWVKAVTAWAKPKPLSSFGLSRPPQSWCYVKKENVHG